MKISVNSVLKLCLGVSAIILSVAAFNFSVQSAHAAPPTPADFVAEETDKIGTYQMTMAAINNGDNGLWSVIVYNTATGASETYYSKGSLSFGPSFNISSSYPAGY